MSTQQDLNSAVSAAVNDALTTEVVGVKKFWQSKTFWTNSVLAGALLIQMKTGFIVGADMQALAITAINVALRKITKDSIVFW